MAPPRSPAQDPGPPEPTRQGEESRDILWSAPLAPLVEPPPRPPAAEPAARESEFDRPTQEAPASAAHPEAPSEAPPPPATQQPPPRMAAAPSGKGLLQLHGFHHMVTPTSAPSSPGEDEAFGSESVSASASEDMERLHRSKRHRARVVNSRSLDPASRFQAPQTASGFGLAAACVLVISGLVVLLGSADSSPSVEAASPYAGPVRPQPASASTARVAPTLATTSGERAASPAPESARDETEERRVAPTSVALLGQVQDQDGVGLVAALHLTRWTPEWDRQVHQTDLRMRGPRGLPEVLIDNPRPAGSTDARGRFSLESAPAGHVLWVHSPGHPWQSWRIPPRGDQPSDGFTLQLDSFGPSDRMSGQVHDAERSLAAQGLLLKELRLVMRRVKDSRRMAPVPVPLDADGKFEALALGSGEHELTLTLPWGIHVIRTRPGESDLRLPVPPVPVDWTTRR